MRTTILPPAEADLVAAVDFYMSEGGADAARGLIEEVRRLASVLAVWPKLGRCAGQGVRVIPLRRFPFSVVYRVDQDEILILAVAHHSRSPRFWRRRL